MEFRYNKTKPVAYAKLALKCGRLKSNAKAVTAAIRGSLLTVGMYDEHNELVAFGRMVGDGHILFLICDIMVDPYYRSFGYELQILGVEGLTIRGAGEGKNVTRGYRGGGTSGAGGVEG